MPRSLFLPTGAGKTSAALLYLLALLDGAPIPRRLVYIVDRRAIVDQTHCLIETWISRLAGVPRLEAAAERMASLPATPDTPLIPVGILRGGVSDGGEWRIDPARPSVVVGTVDMIGSRLLFSGYGDGRTRRPLHAGLLGHDATIVLDEAHLSAPMGLLLERLTVLQHGEPGESGNPRNDSAHRTLRTMRMSATPEAGRGRRIVRGWTPEDEQQPQFRARVRAQKRLTTHPVEDVTALRDKVAALAQSPTMRGAVLIYVTTVRDATRVHSTLSKAIGRKEAPQRCRLLTGTLRGKERDDLMASDLWRRFDPGRPRTEQDDSAPPCYLVATAAGEVGIDIDADNAVMDLAPIDTITQRAGRINRNGTREVSDVHVVWADNPGQVPPPRKQALEATLDILHATNSLAPADLVRIAERNEGGEWRAACAPETACAALGAARMAALSATSLPERDPAIPVFLRGLEDAAGPDTQVVWRKEMSATLAADVEMALDGIDAFPPLRAETLTAPTKFVATEIRGIVARLRKDGADAEHGPTCALGAMWVLRDALGTLKAVNPDDLDDEQLAYGTLFLPAEVGGLDNSGVLRAGAKHPVEDCGDDNTRSRHEVVGAGSPPGEIAGTEMLRVTLRGESADPMLAEDDDPDGVPERAIVYVRHTATALPLDTDRDRFTAHAARGQPLDEHCHMVGRAAAAMACALALPVDLARAVADAGRWHDRGKAADAWQRAAGTPLGAPPVAKTSGGRFNATLLGGYRHEFGSLLMAERDIPHGQDQNSALLRDLTLHLVAAHHGHARPGFANPRHWGDSLPDPELAATALDTELRFERLQRHFGPWQLAWLEAIVKAADAAVSSGAEIP